MLVEEICGITIIDELIELCNEKKISSLSHIVEGII